MHTLDDARKVTNVQRIASRYAYFIPFVSGRGFWNVQVNVGTAEDRNPTCLYLQIDADNVREFVTAFTELQRSTDFPVMANEFTFAERMPFFMDIDIVLPLEHLAEQLRCLNLQPDEKVIVWQNALQKSHVIVPCRPMRVSRIRTTVERMDLPERDMGVYNSPHLRMPCCDKIMPSQTVADSRERSTRYDQLYSIHYPQEGGFEILEVDISAEIGRNNIIAQSMLNNVLPRRAPVQHVGEHDRFDLSDYRDRMQWADMPHLAVFNAETFPFEYWTGEVLNGKSMRRLIEAFAAAHDVQRPFALTWNSELFAELMDELARYFDQHICFVFSRGFRGLRVTSLHPSWDKQVDGRTIWTPHATYQSVKSIPAFVGAFRLRLRYYKVVGENDDGTDKVIRKEFCNPLSEFLEMRTSIVPREFHQEAPFSLPPQLSNGVEVFNTYQGPALWPHECLEIVERRGGDWAVEACQLFFDDFLRDVICADPDENPAYNEFFFHALLHLLVNEAQSPHEGFGWEVVLHSYVQGVGKGQLLDAFRYLFGRDNIFPTVGFKDVFGAYSGMALGKHLVTVDEVDLINMDKAERAQCMAREKKYVTDAYIQATKKLENAHEYKLFASYVLCSNIPIPIPLESRRHLAASVPDNRKNDTEFWTKFQRVLVDEGGYAAVFLALCMMRPNPNFTTRGRSAPVGRIRREFAEFCEDPVKSLLNDWVHQGYGLNTTVCPYTDLVAPSPFMHDNAGVWHLYDNNETPDVFWIRPVPLKQFVDACKAQDKTLNLEEVKRRLSSLLGSKVLFIQNPNFEAPGGQMQSGVYVTRFNGEPTLHRGALMVLPEWSEVSEALKDSVSDDGASEIPTNVAPIDMDKWRHVMPVLRL